MSTGSGQETAGGWVPPGGGGGWTASANTGPPPALAAGFLGAGGGWQQPQQHSSFHPGRQGLRFFLFLFSGSVPTLLSVNVSHMAVVPLYVPYQSVQ